jgi:hypothetical protein
VDGGGGGGVGGVGGREWRGLSEVGGTIVKPKKDFENNKKRARFPAGARSHERGTPGVPLRAGASRRRRRARCLATCVYARVRLGLIQYLGRGQRPKKPKKI